MNFWNIVLSIAGVALAAILTYLAVGELFDKASSGDQLLSAGAVIAFGVAIIVLYIPFANPPRP